MKSHLILTSLAVSLMSAHPALPQTCACADDSTAEQIENSDYAFVGRARGTGYFDDGYVYAEGGGPYLTQFDILEIKKGKSPADGKLFVRHDGDPLFCGIRFSSSQSYLVVGKINNKGQRTTDTCSVVPMPDEK